MLIPHTPSRNLRRSGHHHHQMIGLEDVHITEIPDTNPNPAPEREGKAVVSGRTAALNRRPQP